MQQDVYVNHKLIPEDMIGQEMQYHPAQSKQEAWQKAAEAQKSWFSKLGKGQKIGLGIAAGAAVAIGAYYIYNQMTRKPTDHPHSRHDLLVGGGKSHADRIHTQRHRGAAHYAQTVS